MDEKTAALIENLAEKFGTTVAHLWGVLVTQAPISGFVDLVVCATLVFVAARVVQFVKRKTTAPKKSEKNNQPRAEWVDEPAMLAWACAIWLLLIVGIVVIHYAQDIVAAFFNPEYWALTRILK